MKFTHKKILKTTHGFYKSMPSLVDFFNLKNMNKAQCRGLEVQTTIAGLDFCTQSEPHQSLQGAQ